MSYESFGTDAQHKVFRKDPFPDALNIMRIAKLSPNRIEPESFDDYKESWSRLETKGLDPEVYQALGYTAAQSATESTAESHSYEDQDLDADAVASAMLEDLYVQYLMDFSLHPDAKKGWNSAIAVLENSRRAVGFILDSIEKKHT